MTYGIGIDIGSTATKVAVFHPDKTIAKQFIQPTGWSSIDTAQNVRARLELYGYNEQNSSIAATGYGRICVPYADKVITEITCHAKGAMYLYASENMTVIDIGGQDTKIISIKDGHVTDFIMNDKCSAGTGRFLEIMANRLGLSASELCSLAETGSGITISSLCTVFAESEVISLIGRGEKKENIAYAVLSSIIKKVASQAKRIEASGDFTCLTGGLSAEPYIGFSLEKELKRPLQFKTEGRFAGAYGAGLNALETK
ncbi:MAG TPA: acyl-CoA dehydratase activase [Methanocorpusculum sp.]|nr:acyl-CoA dehydratase activase [Methanocorpusculum sp.]